MVRQDGTKSITSPEVMKDVFDPGYNIGDLSLMEYQANLIPFLVKITKAKEGNKDCEKYHIFNPYNLRIYDNFNEVATDMEEFKQNSLELIKDIEAIGLVIDDDLSFSDEVDIDEFADILI